MDFQDLIHHGLGGHHSRSYSKQLRKLRMSNFSGPTREERPQGVLPLGSGETDGRGASALGCVPSARAAGAVCRELQEAK